TEARATTAPARGPRRSSPCRRPRPRPRPPPNLGADMARGLLYALAGAAIGAVAARAAYAAFTHTRGSTHTRGEADPAGRWTRKNHRGEIITLLEGPAFVAGASAAAARTPGLPARTRAAARLAGAGSGALRA